MSEESISATLEAESHTEETRSFIKQVRRLTRRKFTPEEKIRIEDIVVVAEGKCRCLTGSDHDLIINT